MKLSRPQYGLQQQIVQAIYALRQKKSSQIFRQAVDITKVPDYLEIIKQPMDLTKILWKLKSSIYDQAERVHGDLLLIIANCRKYNRADVILKKADQFMECIETVWNNFKKEIQKKSISYYQKIVINDQILKRISMIEQKRTKKKIPALQAVIEQQKKNILPQSNILPPLELEPDRNDREELPPGCEYVPDNYNLVDRDARIRMLGLDVDFGQVMDEFESVSERKLGKYRKIIKKKLLWFDEKIIKKCLHKKTFQKMQVPKHLNTFIENGLIAEELNIRKLQMYVKKITYWVEDNSNVLSDYMKDKFVDNCRAMKKCILRILKYKRIQRKGVGMGMGIGQGMGMGIGMGTGQEGASIGVGAGVVSGGMDGKVKNEMDFEAINEIEKQDDNYENKMKEFKRMLDKDRQKSTKRDTKIILRNENGVMQVYDWTSDKKQQRGTRKEGGGGTRVEQVDNDEKKKQEERKREELRRDEDFLLDYGKKSNALLVAKYGRRLAIDWELVHSRNEEFAKEILFNFTDTDNDNT